MERKRYPVTPTARKLTAKPLMIWSAWRWMEKKACMRARTPPAAMAPRIPSSHCPVSATTTIPKTAPASIIPSRPMLMTPERSEKIPPIAANASGVAKRSVAATRPTLKTDSSSAESSLWNQTAQRTPRAEAPIAHQPSFRCSRVTLQSPAAAPAMATASGTTMFRRVNGGSESQRASTPSAMPRMAIERGSVARRSRAPSSSAAGCWATLTGGPPPCERVEGVWGNREVSPQPRRRGLVGETWFPPRERAEGERRSQSGLRLDTFGAAERHAPPGAPEVHDQELGSDEGDDQRLDDQGEVRRQLGVEDLGIELARRRAHVERGEEQGREEDAHGFVAAQERDRDAGEAKEVDGELGAREAELPAEQVEAARETGEGAGDGEREEVVLLHGDAAVGGGVGVEADGAYLVPERRAVQEQVVDDQREERDEDARVQGLEAAPDLWQPRRLEDVGGTGEAGIRALEVAVRRLQEPESHPDGDPVQHDRRDDLVGAGGRLQESGDPAPDRAGEDRGDHGEDHVQRGREALEVRPEPDGRQEADPVLALPSDVEHPAAECEGHCECGQDERRHDDERLLEVACLLGRLPYARDEPGEPRALEDGLVGLEGRRDALLGDDHDEPADDEGEQRRGDGDEQAARPLVEGAQARDRALGLLGRVLLDRRRPRTQTVTSSSRSSLPPPSMAMPSSSSETSGGYSPAIRPS